MKIRFLYAAFLTLGLALGAHAQDGRGEQEGALTMAVLSDVHVMCPTLLEQDGKAFADYVNHDRKMLKESTALMEQATRRILDERPQWVLVAGDLTKDGEHVSHEFLRDKFLSRMREAGIRVCVIPGNHDVNNPHAVAFTGDTVRRVASPDAAEFAQLYKEYGYGEALARDPHSLSYVVQLTEGVRLLCLDACEYELNDYAKNVCVTAGRLKPATVEFIRRQAEAARQSGCRLLAMMHHGVVQHWTWQEKAMGEYLVDDWRKQADMLRKAGVEIVFTGHFHAQDIASRKGLYDIETGSLVSYPSPYRLVRLKGDTLSVATRHIDADGLQLPGGTTLQAYGKQFAHSGIFTIVGEMLPSSLPADLRHDVCAVIGDAYVAHLAGDETFGPDSQSHIDAVSARLRKYSWKYNYIFRHVAKYLWSDLSPADNDLTLILRH